MRQISRRWLLAGAAAFLATGPGPRAEIIRGGRPWEPYGGSAPEAAGSGPWQYFTPEEGAAVEALVDRLIPPEPDTPGGRQAGCAVFIDGQLAGAYGSSAALYMRPPFRDGAKSQGSQSPLTPAERYRQALAALETHCRKAYAGRPFARIPEAEQDRIIAGLEDSSLQLEGASGRGFFEILIKDTHHGFLADPIYGGNRDMCAWKMIGFPGAHYDYREWIGRHNQAFPLPPVRIGDGRAGWNPHS